MMRSSPTGVSIQDTPGINEEDKKDEDIDGDGLPPVRGGIDDDVTDNADAKKSDSYIDEDVPLPAEIVVENLRDGEKEDKTELDIGKEVSPVASHDIDFSPNENNKDESVKDSKSQINISSGNEGGDDTKDSFISKQTILWLMEPNPTTTLNMAMQKQRTTLKPHAA